jgi:hypothetical protein
MASDALGMSMRSGVYRAARGGNEGRIMSDKPTDKELEEFYRGLADGAREDWLPKLRASFMCMALLDGTFDVKLAIEVGAALLLDKPLVIVAVGSNVWISARLRQIADVVIEGERFDEAMKAKASAAIERLMRQAKKQNEPL